MRQGQSLKVASCFKYLGVVFHESKGMQVAVDALADRAKAAVVNLTRGYYALRCQHSAELDLLLFKALVQPLCCYGSEVWATMF